MVIPTRKAAAFLLPTLSGARLQTYRDGQSPRADACVWDGAEFLQERCVCLPHR